MNDEKMMARAIELAREGWYTARPNPRVGCVIVADDVIVGEGFHVRAGEPHAEVNALAEAGDEARGATAYVTLEPCSHHGKTPPCADALIDAGIARVVVGMSDPNPLVAGQGLQRLRDAGIEVVEDVLTAQAEALNPGFVQRMRDGRPFVRIKMAMSLDGRTAMASGESQWITQETARADVHRLRAQACAILTGSGTVLADDPSLTFRPDEHATLKDEIPADVPQPQRIVVDSRLQTPETAKLLNKDDRQAVIVTTGLGKAAMALIQAGAQILVVAEKDGMVDLDALMTALANREVNEVLVEAGPTLAGALIQARLADELVIYMAPHLMGDQARGLFSLPGLESMDERIGLNITDISPVGEDWRITATLAS